MKSSTRLDSVTFQLTPTRTRCDLIICANGKTEKIASGLLTPFLAHLKTAQEQMAKGGYSITLEPEPGSDAAWFTKGTIERFVRFVSTPEILERVYTIESEILQIDEAIVFQAENDMGPSVVDENRAKPMESIEGSRSILGANEEKAIVLYCPGANPPEANGSMETEENSKVQLLKVLEARKTALQKEQGMAFARAVAAGFDIDDMSPLISFSECFRATRLMDACKKFNELWKRKHETGQWLEIEAAEASRSDFSAMKASGIILMDVDNNQKDFREAWESHNGLPSENNGAASSTPGADEKTPMNDKSSPGQQEYFQGQYLHPMYPPPWPIHSPPGAVPVFQAYPMQGMPYYQNYAGNSPYFHPPYPASEDQGINAGRRMGHKSRDGKVVSEKQDDLELGSEDSDDEKPRKKSTRSGKKKSGTVVIRNINYITSNKHGSSDGETESESDEEDGEDDNSRRSSKTKGHHAKSTDLLNKSEKEESNLVKETDGHWQAFQNFLLKDSDEDKRNVGEGMFTMEKGGQKERRSKVGDDPLALGGQDTDEFQEGITDMERFSGKFSHKFKTSSNSDMISRKESLPGDDPQSQNGFDLQYTEVDGRRNGYRRTSNEDFLVHRQQTQQSNASFPSDPLAENGFDHSSNCVDTRSSVNMDDDSYIVSLRPVSAVQAGDEDRNAIDIGSEFTPGVHKSENLSDKIASRVSYEPDGLSLIPDRGIEKGSTGYDPALDYDMLVHGGSGVSRDSKNKEAGMDGKQGDKKLDKDRKLKTVSDTLDKRRIGGPVRKGRPSKLSPLDEARARAEKLRTYKADLQKMKKEKEEEDIRRLEALKIERQKRIAARGSSTTAQSSLPSKPTRKSWPMSFSPSSQKASKFSDSEPGPVSPHHRFPVRTASIASNDSKKASKTSRLTQSVTSLPEPKKEANAVTIDTKASMARIRRLSEPKVTSSNHVSTAKPKVTTNGPVSKPKVTNGPESKKISEIINLDKSKAATLPEIKIRTSKGPNITPGDLASKEKPQKMKSEGMLISEGTGLEKTNDKVSHRSEESDNHVIEKTVVMLECEKVTLPSARALEENLQAEEKGHEKKIAEKTDGVSDIDGIHPPGTVNRIDGEPTQRQFYDQSQPSQMMTKGNAEGLSKSSSKGSTDRLYQAPYARVSSLEDPCTDMSQYESQPPPNLENATSSTETAKAYVTNYGNLKLEKIPEALEKPDVKESSKGFKRLLKFGRKNHSSPSKGDRNGEPDNVSISGSEADYSGTNSSSSNEVPTLKNLISQGETPQKTSRPFSFLSPFRKSSEKIAMA